jgi:hypothetical protein
MNKAIALVYLFCFFISNAAAQLGSMQPVKLSKFDSVKVIKINYSGLAVKGVSKENVDYFYKLTYSKKGIGILNVNNQEISSPSLSNVIFCDDALQFMVQNKASNSWGVIDTLGKVIIPLEQLIIKAKTGKNNINFVDIVGGRPDNFGVIYYTKNSESKWGAINTDGKQILPFEYKDFGAFTKKSETKQTENCGYEIGFCWLVNNATKIALINNVGNFITTFEYDDLTNPNKLKTNYEEVAPKDPNDFFKSFDDYKLYFKVEKNKKIGFINEVGKVVVPIQLDYCEGLDYSTGTAIARYNNYYGLINYKGEPVIKFMYNELKWISDELYAAKNATLWSLISNKGATIIPFKYQEIIATKNSPEFSRISGYNVNDGKTGYSIFKYNKKWGLLDPKAQEIMPAIYDEIRVLNDALLLTQTNNNFISSYTLLDYSGKPLSAQKFTSYWQAWETKYAFDKRYDYGVLINNKKENFAIGKDGTLELIKLKNQ